MAETSCEERRKNKG